jgi:hypothetical protein
MEIKRTISRIAYRIEQKPEGGFIARCSDPNVPPLEGASRFELEQQIQAKITAEMESQFPGLKIPFNTSETKFITLGTKPDGSIFSESGNSSVQPAEGGTKNAVEHWLADKAVSLVEKNLPPELIEQLAATTLFQMAMTSCPAFLRDARKLPVPSNPAIPSPLPFPAPTLTALRPSLRSAAAVHFFVFCWQQSLSSASCFSCSTLRNNLRICGDSRPRLSGKAPLAFPDS